jgi:3-oxoacyl-[acyl-carrier protein] reductase
VTVEHQREPRAQASDHPAWPHDLGGEVLLVTGGGSGIGRALCSMAAARQAQVGVIDRDERAAAETVRDLAGAGHASARADVRSRREVFDGIRSCIEVLGRPTALVTCAGISAKTTVTGLEEECLEEMFRANVFGTLYAVQAVLEAMRLNRRGAIVTVSSVAAHTGGGFLGGVHYVSSKGAIIGLTRALARELAPDGIRVNCVAPGPVDTPMVQVALRADEIEALSNATLMGRVAKPEEIAHALLFLIGGTASFITGEVLNVNGGASFN